MFNSEWCASLSAIYFEASKDFINISHAKSDKIIDAKTVWKDEWEKATLSGLGIENDDYFISDEKLLGDFLLKELASCQNANWLYLIAVKLLLFSPYYPLNIDKDKDFKGLKAGTTFEKEVFCRLQNVIDQKELELLTKAYRRNIGILTNNTQKTVTGIAVAAATTIATGGLEHLPHKLQF